MTGFLGAASLGALALMMTQLKVRRWSRLISEGADMVRRGLTDRAEESLRAALALAETARGPFWHSRRLATLLPLAHLLLHRGQYPQAAEVAVEYLEAVRRRAIDSDLIVQGLSLLGDISAARGHLNEAEALYRATLEMEERLMGEHSIGLAPTMVKLGSILQSQSRRGEAAVLFRRCSDLVGNH
jgi:tetratricopeptide (TPR) repeat protein